MDDPTNLPAIRDAQLPQVYVAAQTALAECERIDECVNWADKAAAMASYARQAQDDTLLKTAMRIQSRAMQRVGDLLAQIPDARGGDRRSEDAQRGAEIKKEGARLFDAEPVGRTEAARVTGDWAPLIAAVDAREEVGP